MKKNDQKIQGCSCGQSWAQNVLRGKEISSEHDPDREGNSNARRESRGTRINSIRASRKTSKECNPYNGRGSSVGGIASQFTEDCLEQLADNELEIEMHLEAVARLKNRNQKIRDQLARINELTEKLNEHEED